jgi:hypothetical protein
MKIADGSVDREPWGLAAGVGAMIALTNKGLASSLIRSNLMITI